MSRIKYPGEQEMKRQIQVILDESGMFEDDEKSQGYTECVQVKKRPAVKTAILFPLAAAAVMFLVVTAAGLIPQQTNSRVEPMTNVLTDDTIRSVSKTQLSDDITVQICTDCSYLPLKASGSDSVSDRQIQFSYTYPKIYYQGTEVESVTRYYEDRIEQLKTQAQTQFKNVAFVKDLDIPVKISYHCSALNDVTALENNLVSIYENYSESYTAYDKEGAYVTVMTNAVYGGNFNAKTGKKLSLNELFEENDLSGLEKEWIGIGQTEQELQTIADTDAWYLSQDGLALCINGCENDYENNAGKLRYHNVSCKTNVVAYDTLSGLKKG